MTSRLPLVLLDVDGVLNALARKGDPNVWDDWRCGTASNRLGEWPVVFSPTVAETITRWQTSGLAEVRWLTTWGADANGDLRRLLGLPELTVVGDPPDVALLREICSPLTSTPSHASVAGARARSTLTGRWWKFDLVLELLDREPDRPVVWLDDDLRDEDESQQWMKDRGRALLLAPHRHLGLNRRRLETAER